MISFKTLTDTDVNAMTFIDLFNTIQPLWNKYKMGRGARFMSVRQLNNLEKCLTRYRDLGGDTEYFASGAGSPRACTIS